MESRKMKGFHSFLESCSDKWIEELFLDYRGLIPRALECDPGIGFSSDEVDIGGMRLR
jgi:hypothetical protein